MCSFIMHFTVKSKVCTKKIFLAFMLTTISVFPSTISSSAFSFLNDKTFPSHYDNDYEDHTLSNTKYLKSSQPSAGVNDLILYLLNFKNKFTTPAPKIALIGQTWMNVPIDTQVKAPPPVHYVQNLQETSQSFWYDNSQISSASCGISSDVARTGLEIHNIFRKRHSTEPLQLSDQLSERAQACASYYCDRSESAFHSCPFRGDAGENIYQVGALDHNAEDGNRKGKTTVQNGILDWYKEINFYNFENPACAPLNPASLHFTQMIWRSARQIGFGLCSCSRSQSTILDSNDKYSSNKTVFVALYDTLQRNGSLKRRCLSVIQNVLPPK